MAQIITKCQMASFLASCEDKARPGTNIKFCGTASQNKSQVALKINPRKPKFNIELKQLNMAIIKNMFRETTIVKQTNLEVSSFSVIYLLTLSFSYSRPEY